MARTISTSGDKIVQGTVAIPTTGTIFCWYYPTWNPNNDAAIHTVLRVTKASPLAVFDFLAYNGSADSCNQYFGSPMSRSSPPSALK
jgi:hypothetical protein